jgi:3-oxoacyl-[acyl-carrier protein] reductase
VSSGALEFRAFDLTDIAGIAKFVKSLTREFGPFYGIVNNAAIGTSSILATMPDQAIEQMVRLNVTSPLTLTKYVTRSMIAGTGGRIVNISSVVSSNGHTGIAVYSATKASLVGFTHSLARELGPLAITVNAVAPGFIETDMTHEMASSDRERIARKSALQRIADVADVAHAVEFLFSERARNITGTVVTVDAGATA